MQDSMPVQVFLLIHQPVLMPFLSCTQPKHGLQEDVASLRQETAEYSDQVASFL